MVRTLLFVGLSIGFLGPTRSARAEGNTERTSPRKAPIARPRFPTRAHAALAIGDAPGALAILHSRTLRISDADRRSIEGRAAILLGDTTTARANLRAALQLRPDHAGDAYWLGRAYLGSGSPSLAASFFRKAHWHGFESAELHRHWAEALRTTGQVLGKITQRKHASSAAEAPRAGSLALGGVVVGPVPNLPGWFVVAPPESAVYQAAKALALDSEHAEAHLLLGEIWASMDRHRQAAGSFERAATDLRGLSLKECHQRWAVSLLKLADFEGFLHHMKIGLQQGGGSIEAQLAECYDQAAEKAGALGDLQRQIRYLTVAVELKAEPDRLIQLAGALSAAERLTEATDCLHQALELRPSQKQRREIKRRLRLTTLLASPAMTIRN